LLVDDVEWRIEERPVFSSHGGQDAVPPIGAVIAVASVDGVFNQNERNNIPEKRRSL